ncbi:MAG: hypothetical protein K2X03_07055 [Bryobacteraceae bacterium]|nr:hypothetical protein [Bryobacteraceae bacterium]
MMKKYLFMMAPVALVAGQVVSGQVVHEDVVIHARPGTLTAQPRQIRIESSGQVIGGNGMMQMLPMDVGGSTVKNAPYSAEAVTESVQTLTDGNRITRKNTISQYRDGEGRTRREFELQSMGRLGDVEAGANKSISINDPVAKVHYSLNLKNKTAMKMPAGDGMFNIALAGPGMASATTIRTMERSPGSEHMISFTTKSDDAKEEDLGMRNIEGVEAKGTRSTLTIPAGEVGNEQPLKIVVEKWYSEQLKTHVLTRHSDPRVGETTLRLTNIRLGEPSALLFEVPAGFTVQDAAVSFQQLRKRADEKRQE